MAVSEAGNKSTPAALMTAAASLLSQGRRISEVWVLLLAQRAYSHLDTEAQERPTGQVSDRRLRGQYNLTPKAKR